MPFIMNNEATKRADSGNGYNVSDAVAALVLVPTGELVDTFTDGKGCKRSTVNGYIVKLRQYGFAAGVRDIVKRCTDTGDDGKRLAKNDDVTMYAIWERDTASVLLAKRDLLTLSDETISLLQAFAVAGHLADVATSGDATAGDIDASREAQALLVEWTKHHTSGGDDQQRALLLHSLGIIARRWHELALGEATGSGDDDAN